jgi:hypothetical protein
VFVAAFAAGSATLFFAAVPPTPFGTSSPLELHEWGTFTCLQDETGQSIGGINTDDEPVPSFVHDLYSPLLASATELPPGLSAGGKGILPICIPQITMRLETPVIYFHLPQGASAATFDVNVRFKGGWLTQYYPDAGASPAVSGASIASLSDATTGSLAWHNLHISDSAPSGPVTSDPVWTAPRNVHADAVSIQNAAGVSENEHFLFYRGVGHLSAPLAVTRPTGGHRLEIHGQLHSGAAPLEIPAAWLADIRADGTLAYRTLDPFKIDAIETRAVAGVDSHFDPSAYSAGALQPLRQALRQALTHEGLNPDEAEALLATWQHSYFQSPGLRLLFILPRSWTDQVLPLSVGHASELTLRRAMVGRIEIVSPSQRALLSTIAAGPFGGADWMAQAAAAMNSQTQDALAQLRAGRIPLASLKVSVPPDYAAYLALGRFRQALVLNELSHHPTPALTQFTQAYQINAYQAPALSNSK